MRTIAHISDLHFGRVEQPVAEGLLADLARQRFDVLVVSGDFTQRARWRQYAAAREYMGRLPAGPRVVVPGNHDVPLYDVVRRVFFPLHRYRHYITGDLRPAYQDEELLVLGINSARSFTWKNGWVSAEQLLDVKLRACDLPASVFKVVVTHHPFIPPPGELKKGIIRHARRALAQMEACNVDMLLAGHLHRGYSDDVRTHHEATKRSILSVQAGTAISTRRRNEPNAWNLITVDGGRVTVEVRAWAGDAFGVYARTCYARGADGTWRREGVVSGAGECAVEGSEVADAVEDVAERSVRPEASGADAVR